MIPKNWKTLSDTSLWDAWASSFRSEEDAISVAVWAADKLAPRHAQDTREKFESIKNGYLHRFPHDAAGRKIKIGEISLPMIGLMRLLVYIATTQWGMVYDHMRRVYTRTNAQAEGACPSCYTGTLQARCTCGKNLTCPVCGWGQTCDCAKPGDRKYVQSKF